MIPTARIEHAIPGRLRLRVPEMRGDDTWFADLQRSLAALDGVGRVMVRPATGSVLLEGLAMDPAALLRTAREQRWFAAQPSVRAQRTAREAAQLDGAGEWSLQTLRPSLALVALGLAVVQAARGQVMVPALTLLWFAFELSRRPPAESQPTTWAPAGRSLH